MRKIVINRCWGGFGLSDEAMRLYEAAKSSPEKLYNFDIERDDIDLVKIVEELGVKANGFCARLKIVEIPNDINWEIQDYDGMESIHEVHRSWA